ncbi:MAG: MBOAT family protein [Steroidobacteraceae bacterium]
MLFTSADFLFIYLPIVLGVYFLGARLAGRGLAAAWLALASFVFYGVWSPRYTLLLAASIAFNYVAGAMIQNATERRPGSGRPILVVAVAANLLTLAYFKYANFFLESIAFATSRPALVLDIILPIGISFFTFTQIAYLVDSHHGKVRERNPVHYALFVTYFPHLIAGPVLHHAEMMPQFRRPSTYVASLDSFTIGFAFVAMGMAKKVLLADSAAPYANEIFDAHDFSVISTGQAWAAALAYTLQIYFDFSGYSDMAVGLSLLFGVRLPYNFASPYKSLNIVDFWRRWHMTLSRFLRDYLYISLGGNRKGPTRRYVNLATTMLLGGLWHGASWTFVVWGALHGMYLVINHFWAHVTSGIRSRSTLLRRPGVRALGRACSLALTLVSVIVAWVFFREESLAGATELVQRMFWFHPAYGTGPTYPPTIWIWIAAGFAVALLARNSQELIDGCLSPFVARLSASGLAGAMFNALLLGMLIASIVVLAFISASRDVSEFIYFNF